MKIDIKAIRKKDFNTARKFAIDGIHLHWYAPSKPELYFYSLYFWYLEITKATIALGAYADDKLVGVLLADMQHEPQIYTSIWCRLYLKVMNRLIRTFYGNASDALRKRTPQC